MLNVIISPRQTEVLRLIAQGLSEGEAGQQMGIARATVRNHLFSARAKLNARNTTHAVVIAIRAGFIDPAQSS